MHRRRPGDQPQNLRNAGTNETVFVFCPLSVLRCRTTGCTSSDFERSSRWKLCRGYYGKRAANQPDPRISRMALHLDRLRLQRVGPPATAGVVSLPLPPQSADSLAVDHRCAAWQPLGHYERDGSPRRVLACIADARGVPETLGLKEVERPSKKLGKHPWSATTRITREKLEFQ